MGQAISYTLKVSPENTDQIIGIHNPADVDNWANGPIISFFFRVHEYAG